MEGQKDSCCTSKENKESEGILSGILLGIIPHSFCLAFILFSIFGAVTAAAFIKKALIIPNFFVFLIIFSVLLATLSSLLYLKSNNYLSVSGVQRKWKYLVSVYSGILVVNVLMFFVVFPAMANFDSGKRLREAPSVSKDALSFLTIKTQIPCSGHAPLIIDEIKQNKDVYSVTFSMPNTFNVSYDPKKTSPEEIVSVETLKIYKTTYN